MIKTFYLFGIMVLLTLSSQAQNTSSQRLDTPEKKATFLIRDLQQNYAEQSVKRFAFYHFPVYSLNWPIL